MLPQEESGRGVSGTSHAPCSGSSQSCLHSVPTSADSWNGIRTVVIPNSHGEIQGTHVPTQVYIVHTYHVCTSMIKDHTPLRTVCYFVSIIGCCFFFCSQTATNIDPSFIRTPPVRVSESIHTHTLTPTHTHTHTHSHSLCKVNDWQCRQQGRPLPPY